MRVILGIEGDVQASALRVISAFDEAVSTGTLEALAETAHGLSGHHVGVRDELNARRCFAGEKVPPDQGARIAAAVARKRVRGRDAVIIDVDGEEIMVASIENAGGRLGFCWLQRSDPTEAFDPMNHLISERLAIAAAHDIVQHRAHANAEFLADDSPLEELLGAVPSDLRMGEIARRTRLDLSARYVAVAFNLDPPGSLSTAVLAADVARQLSASTRGGARAVALQRVVAAVVPLGPQLDQALTQISERQGELGVTVRMGVGDPVSPDEISISWRQAKEALALHAMGDGSPVIHFRDLGALQLLRHIRLDQLMESSLYRLVSESLPDARTPSSLELLEVFLDEGSLRKAAARVYLHHTTVESRIRKIEEVLGVDLNEQRVRFELQLVLKAARVVRYTSDLV